MVFTVSVTHHVRSLRSVETLRCLPPVFFSHAFAAYLGALPPPVDKCGNRTVYCCSSIAPLHREPLKNRESYIFRIVGMNKWKSTVCIGAVLTGHFPVQVDACLVSAPCCVFTQRQRAGQSSNAQSEEGRCLGL